MKIKLAYIGGGSKQWARAFMNDLALTDDLEGEIALIVRGMPLHIVYRRATEMLFEHA